MDTFFPDFSFPSTPPSSFSKEIEGFANLSLLFNEEGLKYGDVEISPDYDFWFKDI
jgi:hypothetical protein